MYVQPIQYTVLCSLQSCSKEINDIFNFGVCPPVGWCVNTSSIWINGKGEENTESKTDPEALH